MLHCPDLEKRTRSARTHPRMDYYDNVDERGNKEQYINSYIQVQYDAIYKAIKENNADRLYILLSIINLNYDEEKDWPCDSWGTSSIEDNILYQAVDRQHIDCVKVILGKLRNIDHSKAKICHYRRFFSHNPLLVACGKGNLNIVQMLIERSGAWYFRESAFFIAFEQGHEEIMNYLITKCDLRKCVFREGRTALDCVISGGYIETAKLLIHYGETHRNGDGFSPMMLAVHHHLTPLIDLLFQRLPFEEALR